MSPNFLEATIENIKRQIFFSCQWLIVVTVAAGIILAFGYASKTIFNFLTNIRALPSWGEKIDRAVMVYIDRVARCVRGYDAWSYETNRYYGDDGLKVRECRKITLLPPNSGYTTREELMLETMVA